MRSSLLQDKRQNCVQRLDLSTPIFYCQPNIFNIKRTVRETMVQILQLPEYLDFANEGCTQLVRNKWQNRMLCLHLSFKSFIVKPCIIVPIASASFWWTQHICYISCQFHTIFKDFQGPFSSVCINMQCTIFEESSLCFFLIQINTININTCLWCGSMLLDHG